MEKHSRHYARRFSVEQNCEVAAAIAWSESGATISAGRKQNLSTSMFLIPIALFPLGSTYFGLSNITILYKTLLVMHWDISYVLCTMYPSPASEKQRETSIWTFILVSAIFIPLHYSETLWLPFHLSHATPMTLFLHSCSLNS